MASSQYFDNRIVVTGDSTVLPREEVQYEDTYVYLLKKNLPDCDVMNFSVRSHTMAELHVFRDYYYRYINPKVVIIHVGIVDSYPRPYPQNNVFKFFKAKVDRYLFDVDRFLKRTRLFYLLSDLFNFKIVSLEVFRRTYRDLLKHIDAEKIIVIGIVKAHNILARSRIADQEFAAYNKCLASEADARIRFVDMSELPTDLVLWDGYHLNAQGHRQLAERLIDCIRSK